MNSPLSTSSVNRRQLLTGAVALGAGLTLASCSSPSSGSGGSSSKSSAQVPLLTTESDPRSQKALRDSIADFKKKNPSSNIRLEQAGTSSSRGEQIVRKLQTKQDIGIFELDDNYRLDWVKTGVLEPLDDILDALGHDYYIKGSTFEKNGHVYGLPTQIGPHMTWVRNDILKDLGLPMPENLDDILAFAEKAYNGKSMFGTAFSLGQNASTTSLLFPLIQQHGADYFNPQGEMTFDDPRVLEAVVAHARLLKYSPKGTAAWGYVETESAFLKGNVAVARSSGQYSSKLIEESKLADKTTVLPFDPLGGSLNGKTQWGRWTQLAIYSDCKDKDQAKEFLKFFLSGASMKRWVTVLPGKVSPVPSINDEILKDTSSAYMTKFGRFVKPYFDNAPNAITPASNMGSVVDGAFNKTGVLCPWASQLWGTTAPDITMAQQIALKGADPEKAWQEASASIKQISDKWKADNPDWKP